MEIEKWEILEGIIVYARLLDKTNDKFRKLIKGNIKKSLYENEQLFYEIISEIMRIMPIKTERTGKTKLDNGSGVLLLRSQVPFLEEG